MKKNLSKILDLLPDQRTRTSAAFTISKIVSDKQLVTGAVYEPLTIDAHGHFMLAADIEKMAHKFMSDGLQNSVDVMHDNELIDAVIVESYIAKAEDPTFAEGTWVCTTKINDDTVWAAIKRGDLNGYSMEILTYHSDVEVDIEFSSWEFGFTDPDPYDKHVHAYMVYMNADGEIAHGTTSETDGHTHTISKSSITDKTDGHTHRMHLGDQ